MEIVCLRSVYPSGNKKMNVYGHISLYLAIADTESLPSGGEVNVNFKLFVFDRIRDRYLTIQDSEGRIRRFHRMKNEWGFDQLLPLDTLNDAINGYLIDDCCVFGAEVCVIKHNGEGEYASMVKDPANNIYTWRIDGFSSMVEDFVKSEEFIVGELKWKLKLYPKGYSSPILGKSMSLYLELPDFKTLPVDRKVYAECKLRLRDEIHGNHIEKEVKRWFGASGDTWGYQDFVSLSGLNDVSKGFMVNDTVTIEAQIMLVSIQF